MEPAEIALFMGETLAGGYRPDSFLASGAFCGTFQSRHPRTGVPVAVKVLKVSRLSADATKEFQDEVAMLRRLNGCSCVVDLLDAGQHTILLRHPATGAEFPVTTEFAVLELAAGSLAELLLAGATLGWPDRLKLYRDVVKGLHQMHLGGFVHRDLKAENVLVFENPGGAKIADLGRAHNTKQPPRFAIEAYLMGRGDPRFAPLEFLWGQGTQDPYHQALADLYLLGSLLFEIGTGVALTPVVATDPLAVMRASAAASSSERLAAWKGHIPGLRESTRVAATTFAEQVPPPIRDRASRLLSLLTDPQPEARVPSRRGGRRPLNAWNLEWVLSWVDSMRRVVDADYRRTYLATRPGRSKSSRPRSRKP